MKKGSTLFLKSVILLIAFGSLASLIYLPLTEGRATNLNLINIYTDPFILYTYVATIPFFIALFQAIKLLGYIDENNIFSSSAVKTLRDIKYCALACICFLIVAVLYIQLIAQGDDPAGPTMLGIIAIFASTVIATSCGVFQKLLQNAVDIKSENDLTV